MLVREVYLLRSERKKKKKDSRHISRVDALIRFIETRRALSRHTNRLRDRGLKPRAKQKCAPFPCIFLGMERRETGNCVRGKLHVPSHARDAPSNLTSGDTGRYRNESNLVRCSSPRGSSTRYPTFQLSRKWNLRETSHVGPRT